MLELDAPNPENSFANYGIRGVEVMRRNAIGHSVPSSTYSCGCQLFRNRFPLLRVSPDYIRLGREMGSEHFAQKTAECNWCAPNDSIPANLSGSLPGS